MSEPIPGNAEKEGQPANSTDGARIADAIDRLTAELRHQRETGPPAPAVSVVRAAFEFPEEPRPQPVLPEPQSDPLAEQQPVPRRGRPGPIAIILAALLVFLGQRTLESGTAIVTLSRETTDRLRPTWENPNAVVSAILLFIAALGVLILSASFRGRPWPGVRTLYRYLDGVSIACIGAGLGLFLWLMLLLRGGEYEPSYPRWYVLSITLIVIGFVRRERKLLRACLPTRLTRYHLAEAAGVLALVGVFLFLAMRDIRSWRFVSIGDEHAFFDVALWFSDGRGPQNLFRNEGAYGYHPILSSYLVAQVMRVFGEDVFGWRLGYNLLAAIGLVFFYALAKTMFNRTIAFVALGMIVTSHYLLAFAHIGYNNLEPTLTSCAALFFFVLGVRRSSATLMLVAGIFAGLGFYTFYSGRITIGILAIATALVVERRHWIRTWLLVGLGFLLAALPIFIVSGSNIYERMKIETLATPEGPPRSDLDRILINSGRSLIAFNYNRFSSHYVTGSLAEPLTATLFVVGLFLAITTLRDWRSRLLVLWFVIGITATGVASKYDHIPVTRMHYVLPCVVLLASVAGYQIVRSLTVQFRPELRTWLVWGALAIIVGASTFLDLRRWYVTTPAIAGSSHTGAIWRAVTTQSCRDLPMDPLLVTFDGDGNIDWVLREHKPDFAVEHAHYADPETWIETAPQRCIVFRNADQPEARALIAATLQRWPSIVSTVVADSAGTSTVEVLAPVPIELDN